MASKDLIGVSFVVVGQVISGTVVRDILHRTKKVFIHKYVVGESAPPGVHLPKNGEFWFCKVERDTNAHDPGRGVLIIKLVLLGISHVPPVWVPDTLPPPAPLKQVYGLHGGRVLRLPPLAQQVLATVPGAVALFPEIVSYAEVPSKVPEPGRCVAIEVDLERVIGIDPVVATAEIPIHQLTLFAMLPHHRHPVRVIAGVTGSPTTRVTLILARDADPKTFVLRMAYIGRRVPPTPRPEDAEQKSRDTLAFWCKHAFAYDARFGETNRVHPSTWRTELNLSTQGEYPQRAGRRSTTEAEDKGSCP